MKAQSFFVISLGVTPLPPKTSSRESSTPLKLMVYPPNGFLAILSTSFSKKSPNSPPQFDFIEGKSSEIINAIGLKTYFYLWKPVKKGVLISFPRFSFFKRKAFSLVGFFLVLLVLPNQVTACRQHQQDGYRHNPIRPTVASAIGRDIRLGGVDAGIVLLLQGIVFALKKRKLRLKPVQVVGARLFHERLDFPPFAFHTFRLRLQTAASQVRLAVIHRFYRRL